jgi:hypothetical protein
MKHRDDDLEYEPRRPGTHPNLDNRNNSNDELEIKQPNGISKKQQRCMQILEVLNEYNGHPLTAKEIARELMYRGYTKNDERNNAAPRLTEMMQKGIVEPKGSRYDNETQKRVTVWGLYNGSIQS